MQVIELYSGGDQQSYSILRETDRAIQCTELTKLQHIRLIKLECIRLTELYCMRLIELECMDLMEPQSISLTDKAILYEKIQWCICHTVFTFRICESRPSNSRSSRVGPLYVALLLAARPSQQIVIRTQKEDKTNKLSNYPSTSLTVFNRFFFFQQIIIYYMHTITCFNRSFFLYMATVS